ncbi:Uu.00g071960.m01.CDS01 [Anthostomella pinea]|uniref:Uu.00g071960.m01.CDS01 n=1 Tax=Anthostomella pinea TaxID=933095 RepID=A0AAI8YNX7_9PEZI|nr:Uu.00g071960.m01.CDS01 [Anthostomella pinea]
MLGFKGKSGQTGQSGQLGSKGTAWIILNVIRCCNIAVLLSVMVTCVLMMIFAKMPSAWQFFDDVTLAFVLSVAGLLIFSEVGLWEKGQAFVAATWPILGPSKGFTWLGAIISLMGCHLLGSLSNETYTSKSVPKQVSQIMMGSGIICLTFGISNVIASLAFRNKKNGLRARAVRKEGATVSNVVFHDNYSTSSSPSYNEKRVNISGPIPQNQDLEQGYSHSEYTLAEDDRRSPIMPELKRPDTALHPANRSSSYSETSHLTRFTQLPENKF